MIPSKLINITQDLEIGSKILALRPQSRLIESETISSYFKLNEELSIGKKCFVIYFINFLIKYFGSLRKRGRKRHFWEFFFQSKKIIRL